MQIEWLPYQAAVLYIAVWLLAFVVAFVRILATERIIPNLRISIFSSCVVGFISLCFVAIRTGDDPNNINGHVMYLGYSILFGLAGPWQQQIIKAILKRNGIDVDKTDKD